MNPEKTFIFHEDAGHGWLAVKRQDLIDLGILDKVSSCSYEKGDTVYLEEDDDAPIFIRAIKAKGLGFKYRDHIHPNFSPIRRYARFQPRKCELSS